MGLGGGGLNFTSTLNNFLKMGNILVSFEVEPEQKQSMNE